MLSLKNQPNRKKRIPPTTKRERRAVEKGDAEKTADSFTDAAHKWNV